MNIAQRIRMAITPALDLALAYLLSACAFVWRRVMFRTTFIAITGSVGKSTTTACLGTILSAHYPTNWSPGGRNHRRVLAEIILRTRFHHRFTVIEVGTRAPGALRRAAWMIAPDVVVMLRVLNVHSNAFPTLHDMAHEKAQLLSRLGRKGMAILNADDPLVMAMASPRIGQVRTFGLSPAATVTASDVSSPWPQRLRFTAVTEAQPPVIVQTPFVGKHLLNSSLAALTAATACGVPLAKAASPLATVEPVSGRMSPVTLPNGADFIDNSFNSTLPAFDAAMDMMRDAKASRRVVIAGDLLDAPMSERGRARYIGTAVAGVADVGIFLGRSADSAVSAATHAGMARPSAHTFKTLPDAVSFLRSELRPGDLVLLHGWTSRHPERVLWALLGDIACWRAQCHKAMRCDECPELQLVRFPEASGTHPGRLREI